jgi:hypothetical protein
MDFWRLQLSIPSKEASASGTLETDPLGPFLMYDQFGLHSIYDKFSPRSLQGFESHRIVGTSSTLGYPKGFQGSLPQNHCRWWHFRRGNAFLRYPQKGTWHVDPGIALK